MCFVSHVVSTAFNDSSNSCLADSEAPLGANKSAASPHSEPQSSSSCSRMVSTEMNGWNRFASATDIWVSSPSYPSSEGPFLTASSTESKIPCQCSASTDRATAYFINLLLDGRLTSYDASAVPSGCASANIFSAASNRHLQYGSQIHKKDAHIGFDTDSIAPRCAFPTTSCTCGLAESNGD